MDYSDVEILLVEDNPYDVEMTMNALKHGKISNKIFVARDGAEALDFIFAKGKYSNRNISVKPRVILLDLKLPKKNGLEVLREIRRNEPTKSIPVVILTSSQEENDIVESYKLGVNSYIVKPVDFDNFTKAISNIGLYWLILNKPPF